MSDFGISALNFCYFRTITKKKLEFKRKIDYPLDSIIKIVYAYLLSVNLDIILQ